jgi:AcrR family transcriptional regulator
MDRTAALFASRGYAATSIGDIALACECSKSRLYHYFESKEGILSAMMSEHVDKLLDECDATLKRGGTPVARFHRLIRYFLEVYAVSRDKHVVLLTCLDFLPPEKRAVVVAKQRKLIAYLTDILVAIRPDLRDDMRTTHVDTMLFFGMINWTYTWFSSSGKVTSEELADRVVNLFLKGYGFIDSPAERPIPTQ